MNRRQAITAIGAAGLVLPGGAAADPAPLLRVTVAIPELYDTDGKLAFPATLRNAGYGFRFFVVVENVSTADQFVWSEDNSEGHGSLSFEVVAADGVKTTIRRIGQVWGKNIFRAERLAPGSKHVRAVEYDAPTGKSPGWEPVPFGPKGSKREVTLRATFEQTRNGPSAKLAVWAGRMTSPAHQIVLQNA